MPHLFVTLVYGVLDTRTGVVTYCNAGHNLPYVLRDGEAVAELPRSGGIGLCLAKDFDYRARTETLRPGDSLFLFTDGITEAMNRARIQFSDERLRDRLRALAREAPAQVIRDVLQSVTSFADGAPSSDDITMMAIRYEGPR